MDEAREDPKDDDDARYSELDSLDFANADTRPEGTLKNAAVGALISHAVIGGRVRGTHAEGRIGIQGAFCSKDLRSTEVRPPVVRAPAPSSRLRVESVAVVVFFFVAAAVGAVLGGLRVLALSFASEASRLARASDVSEDRVCLTSSDVVDRVRPDFLVPPPKMKRM